MQFDAVEAVGVLEELSVNYPALAFLFTTGDQEIAIGFRVHAGKLHETRLGFFERDGKCAGSREEVDVKMEHREFNRFSIGQLMSHLIAFGRQILGVVLVDGRDDGDLVDDFQVETPVDESVGFFGVVGEKPHFS